MKQLQLSIGAYTSTDYHQAVLDAVEILQEEALAVWMFEQNIAVNIEVNPRVSKRFSNSNSNPIFTADFVWVLADDVQTALHLKFYPLPIPQDSIGVWTITQGTPND
jgi:hypothetical protein